MYKEHVEMAWKSLLSVFGETIKVYPKYGKCFTTEGVFRDESEKIGPDFSSTQVRVGCPYFKYMPKKSKIRVGDRVCVRGNIYITEEKIPDGHGGFLFELHLIGEQESAS